MIKSFADKDTARVFARGYVRRLAPALHPVAWRKLAQLHAATRLDSLRVPPGNRLEALKLDRAGQHSIRINDQSGRPATPITSRSRTITEGERHGQT